MNNSTLWHSNDAGCHWKQIVPESRDKTFSDSTSMKQQCSDAMLACALMHSGKQGTILKDCIECQAGCLP